MPNCFTAQLFHCPGGREYSLITPPPITLPGTRHTKAVEVACDSHVKSNGSRTKLLRNRFGGTRSRLAVTAPSNSPNPHPDAPPHYRTPHHG